MSFQWASLVSILCGGGLLWKLRVFATPGPNIALSDHNVPRSRVNPDFPKLLEVENIGDKAAQNITWEIRDHSSVIVPPQYEMTRHQHPAPLKPGGTLIVDVGTTCADAAFLADLEVIMSYRGPNRAKFFSHFVVEGGRIKTMTLASTAHGACAPFLTSAF